MANDFIVRSRSWKSISQIALDVRKNFGFLDKKMFPIIDFMEEILDQRLGLFTLEVGTTEEMGIAEGLTCPKGEFIQLREDVYCNVCNNDGRARFTAAHELGHYLLHTGMPLARSKIGDNPKPYQLAEPQANHFASQLLMPPNLLRKDFSAKQVADEFGVSNSAAEIRMKQFRQKGY